MRTGLVGLRPEFCLNSICELYCEYTRSTSDYNCHRLCEPTWLNGECHFSHPCPCGLGPAFAFSLVIFSAHVLAENVPPHGSASPPPQALRQAPPGSGRGAGLPRHCPAPGPTEIHLDPGRRHLPSALLESKALPAIRTKLTIKFTFPF